MGFAKERVYHLLDNELIKQKSKSPLPPLLPQSSAEVAL